MTPNQSPAQIDLFNLARFVSAQEGIYDCALSELKRGAKQSHWMWFIFPQLDGLGSSTMAKKYAVRSVREARAFMDHPILGCRLLDCCRALLGVQGRSASEIMGHPDDLKLRSSMTLFSVAAPEYSEFNAVIAKFYRGELDQATLKLLKLEERRSS